VNGSDFAILAGNFGKTMPAPAAATVGADAKTFTLLPSGGQKQKHNRSRVRPTLPRRHVNPLRERQ
jgi:hypothetical protein